MGKHIIPGLGLTITAPSALSAADMQPLLVGMLELMQYNKGPIINTRKTWEASLAAASTGEAPCVVALGVEVQLFASVLIMPANAEDFRRLAATQYAENFESWELRNFAVTNAFLDFDFLRCIELGGEALLLEPADIFTLRTFFLACFFVGEYNVLADVMGFVLSKVKSDDPAHCLALPYIQGIAAFAFEEAGDAVGNIDKSIGGTLWKMVVESLEMVEGYNQKKLLGYTDWGHPYAVHTLFHIACHEPANTTAHDAFKKYEHLWVNTLHLSVHLWWHKALLMIDNNDFKGALEIYDTQMDRRIVQGDQYSLSDGSQLLLRLYIEGAITASDVRVSPLASKWAANAGNKYLAQVPFFITNMAALVPLLNAKGFVGSNSEKAAIFGSLVDATANNTNTEIAVVVNAFTYPTAENLVMSWRRGSRTRWASCGGSFAQRDLFLRYLGTHVDFPYAIQVLLGEAAKHPNQSWVLRKLEKSTK